MIYRYKLMQNAVTSVAFDFDGVLHTCVHPPDLEGQVHAKFTDPEDLIDCKNEPMLALLQSIPHDVHIVSNNRTLGETGIRRCLDAWGVLNVKQVHVVPDDKSEVLKRIHAKEFYDDSTNRLRQVAKGYPDCVLWHVRQDGSPQLFECC